MVKLIGNKPVEYRDTGLFEGPIPVVLESLPEKEQVMKWNGRKIPAYMWKQIVAFMRWSHEQYKGEAQLRLFYNENWNMWRVVVMPQYINMGLFTEEVETHELRDVAFAEVPAAEGWCENGTVHHHCTSSAFQSGTDHADEIQKIGLHVTLGFMTNRTKHDLHSRVTFKGVCFDTDLSEWIGMPEEDIGVPVLEDAFPKKWRKFCMKKPVPTRTAAAAYRSNNVWPAHNSNTNVGRRTHVPSGGKSYSLPSQALNETRVVERKKHHVPVTRTVGSQSVIEVWFQSTNPNTPAKDGWYENLKGTSRKISKDTIEGECYVMLYATAYAEATYSERLDYAAAIGALEGLDFNDAIDKYCPIGPRVDHEDIVNERWDDDAEDYYNHALVSGFDARAYDLADLEDDEDDGLPLGISQDDIETSASMYKELMDAKLVTKSLEELIEDLPARLQLGTVLRAYVLYRDAVTQLHDAVFDDEPVEKTLAVLTRFNAGLSDKFHDIDTVEVLLDTLRILFHEYKNKATV